MQTSNNYQKEVFNGDIGRIRKIDAGDQELTVDYDGRAVVYEFDELDELTLAYALTIHKSQAASIPPSSCRYTRSIISCSSRNLLYTAVTRGRKLVVVIGSKKALALAVERHNPSERCTALRQRCKNYNPDLLRHCSSAIDRVAAWPDFADGATVFCVRGAPSPLKRSSDASNLPARRLGALQCDVRFASTRDFNQ